VGVYDPATVRRRVGAHATSSYKEARQMGIEGRSQMNKAQLERAVERRKRSRS
jgi:hypothetical protein